ncbi:MAG: hypothetical protein GWO24_16400 [Akkermansiaceae bacterium]|nr:hypothetical protein [Akkermansiaceae bacterium]
MNDDAGKGSGSSAAAVLDLDVIDVTASREVQARGVEHTTPAGSVARALAARMALPNDVPWALRHDRTGVILDEESPIGEQVETGSRVVLTPKSHLGGLR